MNNHEICITVFNRNPYEIRMHGLPEEQAELLAKQIYMAYHSAGYQIMVAIAHNGMRRGLIARYVDGVEHGLDKLGVPRFQPKTAA